MAPQIFRPSYGPAKPCLIDEIVSVEFTLNKVQASGRPEYQIGSWGHAYVVGRHNTPHLIRIRSTYLPKYNIHKYVPAALIS